MSDRAVEGDDITEDALIATLDRLRSRRRTIVNHVVNMVDAVATVQSLNEVRMTAVAMCLIVLRTMHQEMTASQDRDRANDMIAAAIAALGQMLDHDATRHP